MSAGHRKGEPYWHDTPTTPGIRVSEVRMAVRKKLTSAERSALETLVSCPGCRGVGMVTPSGRTRMLAVMPELKFSDVVAADDLDEDGEP